SEARQGRCPHRQGASAEQREQISLLFPQRQDLPRGVRRMKWCRSCVLPDTRPNLIIGADGICNACKSHGTKRAIDWAARSAAFAKVVEHARSRRAGYDCVIPVSGGKDSTWQVAKCARDGLRILAVTWRTPGRTAVGQANLDNLRRLGERGPGHVD